MLTALVVFNVVVVFGTGFLCGKLHERIEWNRKIENGALRIKAD